MSELINKRNTDAKLRNNLLTNVSAFALLSYVWMLPCALAAPDDEDHPTVWIELGGQLERLDSAQSLFSPAFFSKADPAVLAPMVMAQRPPGFAIGEEGKVSFTPDNSDWIFSASVRYGRANAAKHLHYQSEFQTVVRTLFGHAVSGGGYPKDKFGDGQSNLREAHVIADFQAGKDVGLGMFGRGSISALSAGIRFAQFTSKSDVSLHAQPVYVIGPFFTNPGKYTLHGRYFASNTAVVHSTRSVEAVGPTASWDASVSLIGNNSTMEFALDWGANAAILFGRQRARVHHQTKGNSAHFAGFPFYATYTNYTRPPVDHDRSRTVTIPNVGGFAGLSLKFPNAKVALGYRADMFFGAMDNGIDTAKKENIGFYGPFATISIGLGG
jgi:hypothetical protein